MHHRRKLVIALGGSALTALFAARAQQPAAPAGPPGKIWRIGYLTASSRAASILVYTALMRRLRELGYVEGGNLVIEARYADQDDARLPGLAAELVQLKVDLIIAIANFATSAAKAATTTIPIVMPLTNDPVGNGYVNSLARPGGNITGLADISVELGPKRLEMLLAMMASPVSSKAATKGAKAPKVSRVAMLLPSDNPVARRFLATLQEGASSVGVTIVPVYALTPEAIDQAFAGLREQKVTALIVPPAPAFLQQRNQIAQSALRHRVPVATPYAIFADAGCLLSYGLDPLDNMRRSATFIDKIFKGTKPADLPVEQPVRFELVINGKTATALGLKIPQALLILADRVIE